MIRTFLFACFLVFAACMLAFRYENRREILENGTEILVPVFVHKTELGDHAAKISFRYHGFIPASQIASGSGTAVIRRHAGGRASFVRMFDPNVPLRPREHLLKFSLNHKTGMKRSTEASKIRFASDAYVLLSEEKIEELMERPKELRIKYAVLKVNGDGEAALWGIADQNGVVLSTLY